MASKSDNIHVNIEHDNEYDFKVNKPNTSAETNKSESIYIDAPTRSFNRLAPALNPGEFKGVPTIPQLERNIKYNSNYETSKTLIAKKIMKELK